MKDQNGHGHHNICTRLIGGREGGFPAICGGRYWVRAADLGKGKVTRFTDESCATAHACRVLAAPRAAIVPTIHHKDAEAIESLNVLQMNMGGF